MLIGNYFSGQFFAGGFFGLLMDMHDGDEDAPRKRAEDYKRRNEQLRADIVAAINGPQAEEVIEELSPYIERTPTKAVIDFAAIRSRIDSLAALKADIERQRATEETRRLIQIAMKRAEEDDEDVILLLQ